MSIFSGTTLEPFYPLFGDEILQKKPVFYHIDWSNILSLMDPQIHF